MRFIKISNSPTAYKTTIIPIPQIGTNISAPGFLHFFLMQKKKIIGRANIIVIEVPKPQPNHKLI